MNFLNSLLLTGLTIVFASSQATASLLGLDLAGSPAVFTTFTSNLWTLGYRFSVSQPVTVDGLGFWDSNNAFNDTTVALWHTDGTLITSVNSASTPVTTSTTGNGHGYWNFMDTSAVLAAGQYVVGSWGDGMEFTYAPPGGQIATQVLTFQGTREKYGGIFQFPSDEFSLTREGYFGGNVSFATGNGVPADDVLANAVPEATPLIVWSLLGMIGVSKWPRSFSGNFRNCE